MKKHWIPAFAGMTASGLNLDGFWSEPVRILLTKYLSKGMETVAGLDG
jgi:hypothetical protein